MIKLFNAYFPKRTILLVVSESLLILIALLALASLGLGSRTEIALRYEYGYVKIAVVYAVCFISIYYNDLYDPRIISNRREVPLRIIQGLGAACLVVALVYELFPSGQVYRGFGIVAMTLVGVMLILFRQVFFALNSYERLAEPVVVIGEGPLAQLLAKEIATRPELGLRLVGYLGQEWDSHGSPFSVPRLGAIEDLGEVANRVTIRRVIVAMGDMRRKLPVEDLLHLKTSGVSVEEGSDFYEISTGKLPIDTLRLSWLIFSPGFQISWPMAFCRRLFAVVLAAIALFLLFPLMALIGLIIRLDSHGPALFSQPRIGKDGQTFVLLKFRTMYVNSDSDSGGLPVPVQDNDKRVTRVGKWLRRSRLDEIPQLYNILLGDMSFVGPRPFVPNQEEELASQIPLYSRRWSVRPGATGWAQVMRGYCATLEDNREKLAYDLFYIKNISFSLDLLILFKTVKILLLGRGGR